MYVVLQIDACGICKQEFLCTWVTRGRTWHQKCNLRSKRLLTFKGGNLQYYSSRTFLIYSVNLENWPQWIQYFHRFHQLSGLVAKSNSSKLTHLPTYSMSSNQLEDILLSYQLTGEEAKKCITVLGLKGILSNIEMLLMSILSSIDRFRNHRKHSMHSSLQPYADWWKIANLLNN